MIPSVLDAWSRPEKSIISPKLLGAVKESDSLEKIVSFPRIHYFIWLDNDVRDNWRNESLFKINHLVIDFVRKNFQQTYPHKEFPKFFQALHEKKKTSLCLKLFRSLICDECSKVRVTIMTHLIEHERDFLMEILEKEHCRLDIPLPVKPIKEDQPLPIDKTSVSFLSCLLETTEAFIFAYVNSLHQTQESNS